ncbi:MAG: TlpA family protein disulfide reductase [Nitrososphaerales archaeon]
MQPNRESALKVLPRNSQKTRTIGLIIFLLGLFTALTIYPDGLPEIVTESSATNDFNTYNDFRNIPLQDVDGNTIYVNDFKGKVVALEFMATWCLVCAQQEPILKELNSKYKDENFVLLSVSIDPAYDTPDVLRNHIAKKGISWLITRDTTLMMTDYFKVTELATILIITPDGEVVNVFKGLTDLDTLSRAIDALL